MILFKKQLFDLEVKVPRRSLRYATHRLMVMHPHNKYHWPISKDKNVMVQTRKYYFKKNIFDLEVKVSQRSLRYATHHLMVMHPHTWMILYKKQLFDFEVKGQGPTKIITVCDTPRYGHAPTYQISLTYLERRKCYGPDKKILVMGIGNIFKIDDRYINIDRWSIIGDNCLLNVFTDYN